MWLCLHLLNFSLLQYIGIVTLGITFSVLFSISRFFFFPTDLRVTQESFFLLAK
jgi:hypothetical protein